MAPKSSDPELTQPMETSTVVALSLLGKRRAETPSPDDSGESEQISTDEGEEEEGGDEDGGEIDRNEELKWGYDSFDDRKYDSSDQKEYVDKEFERQCRHYRCQVIATKGFFETSDSFPPYCYAGVASICDLEEEAGEGLTIREFCADLTSSCLKRYNEEKGLNVKLEHIMKANFNPGSMSKFYITFAARESDCPDAPLVEYQAKAAWSVSNKTYPIFCRPSPPPTRDTIHN